MDCDCLARAPEDVCLRWGHYGLRDQCLLERGHLGPCVTSRGVTMTQSHAPWLPGYVEE